MASAAQVKIERAEELNGELCGAVQEFFDANPYEIHFESPDTTTGTVRARIRAADEIEIPGRIASIVGDIAHNLRTAMNYQVCDLVRANGGVVDERHSFPIGRGSSEYVDGEQKCLDDWEACRRGDKARRARAIAGVSDAAAARITELLYTVETVVGHPVYQVHEVNRKDKHRQPSVILGEGQWKRQAVIRGEEVWIFGIFALVDGAICYDGPHPPPSEFIEARPRLIFDEPACVALLPIDIWAHDGIDGVRRICEALATHSWPPTK